MSLFLNAMSLEWVNKYIQTTAKRKSINGFYKKSVVCSVLDGDASIYEGLVATEIFSLLQFKKSHCDSAYSCMNAACRGRSVWLNRSRVPSKHGSFEILVLTGSIFIGVDAARTMTFLIHMNAHFDNIGGVPDSTTLSYIRIMLQYRQNASFELTVYKHWIFRVFTVLHVRDAV